MNSALPNGWDISCGELEHVLTCIKTFFKRRQLNALVIRLWSFFNYFFLEFFIAFIADCI